MKSTYDDSAASDVVGMCFAVVHRGDGSTGGEMRIRLEFRPDLHATHGALINARGTDAARDAFELWLAECSQRRDTD